MIKFSIIIPVVKINDYIHETVRHILNLDFQDFEILILPDSKTQEKFPKTKIIPTGKIGPAEKRNLGGKRAQGEILAFLDDDAYPEKRWLTRAWKNFQDPKIAALGGPAITPREDNIFQKTSGACLASSLFGGIVDRYRPGKQKKLVEDWPSVNLLVRKEIFQKIGGFNSRFWPGEDTKFCLDLIQDNNKIIYDPALLVYHHRRMTLKGHLKQTAGYGSHRGFFAKKFPKTSRKLAYAFPSLFVLFLVFAIIVIALLPGSRLAYFAIFILGIYAASLFFFAIQAIIREKNFLVGILIIPYLFFTHIVYGVKFLQGLVFTRVGNKNLYSLRKQG